MAIRKVLLRIIVFLSLTLFLLVTFTKTESGKDLLTLLKSRLGMVKEASRQDQISDVEVIEQLNNYRVSLKLNAFKKSDPLGKAALARLTVIESNNDYSGELTGVTLENAVKNNDYNFGLVGELDAINVIAGLNLVEYWTTNKEAAELLSEKNLTDIGLVVKQKGTNWDIVVVLARPLKVIAAPRRTIPTWGGIELWEEVNKRRKELGVNPLSKKEELCTIASIRLNQLLDLGKLDGHAGLAPTLSRPDLSWIREKYDLAEFLVAGYPTPEESVHAWENTLGHRDLLAGGQYVSGDAFTRKIRLGWRLSRFSIGELDS